MVDKCQVTLVTDAAKAEKILKEIAMPTYEQRDDRLNAMTDESVDTFYTCTMCQSFAPAHCCVVTPERLGLCGAVSWLDAKATNQLNPTGPCPSHCQDGLYGRAHGRLSYGQRGRIRGYPRCRGYRDAVFHFGRSHDFLRLF